MQRSCSVVGGFAQALLGQEIQSASWNPYGLLNGATGATTGDEFNVDPKVKSQDIHVINL